jgi:hypothetical protein
LAPSVFNNHYLVISCGDHFEAFIFSEKDYNVVRRVKITNGDWYSTYISIIDGEMIYSNFTTTAQKIQSIIKRGKCYVYDSDEDLIDKINSLVMLK